MRIKEGFTLREVCGEYAVVGEGLAVIDFRKIVALNEAGAFLWKKAKELGDFTTEDLTTALCEEYEVSESVAQHDVNIMLEQWKQLGLLVKM